MEEHPKTGRYKSVKYNIPSDYQTCMIEVIPLSELLIKKKKQ